MRKLKLVFMILSAVALLISCGKKTDTTESGKMKDVVYVFPRTIEVLEDTPFWVALKMGYFAEEGLNVKLQDGGSDDIKMVASKQANFAGPSPNMLLTAIESGMPVQSIHQYDVINIFGFAVPEGSPIKTWSDLKGKTIALGYPAWEAIFTPTLAAAGLDPKKDIKFQVVGEQRAAMVKEGKIDVLATWIGEIYQLNGMGMGFRYIDGNEVLENCANSIITHTDTIKNDPELVKKFSRALAKGTYFVYANPEAGADIVLEQFPMFQPQVSWDAGVAIQKGRVAQNFGLTPEENKFFIENLGIHIKDRWENNVKWAVDTDIIKKPLPLDKVYLNDYVDQTWDKAKVEADAKNYEYKVKEKIKK